MTTNLYRSLAGIPIISVTRQAPDRFGLAPGINFTKEFPVPIEIVNLSS